MQRISSSTSADPKPCYVPLDGLRGVAALLVIWYHVFEGFIADPIDQKFNHEYLITDFFLTLSGFVIGCTYDDRQKTTMTQRKLFECRLIRLHPMIVMGAVLGVIISYIQGCEQWDDTRISILVVTVAMLLSLLLIPAVPNTSSEACGNDEVYPLDGSSWSSFFEYIGDILYALSIRRMSIGALAILVIIAETELASPLICNLSGSHHSGVGWLMIGYNLARGFLCMLFAFSIRLSMSRMFRLIHIKGAFWICSLLIPTLLTMPYVDGETSPWMNGVYDTVCTALIFPLLVYLDVSGKATDGDIAKICKFLGDASYLAYIIHYPFIYPFYTWLQSKEPYVTFSQSWPAVLCVFLGSIMLAYLCLKLYGESVRKWLSKRLLMKK